MSLLLGIDLGTSFIKVSVVEAGSGKCLATLQYPEKETVIVSKHPGWAEQSPQEWWENVCAAILLVNSQGNYDAQDIESIGISYQMHGLVIVDKAGRVLRDAIIWCDSRAADGAKYPFGNFTASKLAWVKENEPDIYSEIYKILLPGDFIAMKLTGMMTTTVSALSEGMFWDFTENSLSESLFELYDFSQDKIPEIKAVFDNHGTVKEEIALKWGISKIAQVNYKAGDQINNALSLNVFEAGEVAATAGTSGVIYAITQNIFTDPISGINQFAHVNHTQESPHLGLLLCINGCGSAYSFIRNLLDERISYEELNRQAASVPVGSDGLLFLPFGNGSERMLEGYQKGAQFVGLDFNRHTAAHMIRAVQEGIAFAFRYGLDMMKESGFTASVVRAGYSNLFLSEGFTQSFVNSTGLPVELYEVSGSIGAAKGAGIGAGLMPKINTASELRLIQRIEVGHFEIHNKIYKKWRHILVSCLS